MIANSELGHVLTAQQISDDHVLDMINSSEGQAMAALSTKGNGLVLLILLAHGNADKAH